MNEITQADRELLAAHAAQLTPTGDREFKEDEHGSLIHVDSALRAIAAARRQGQADHYNDGTGRDRDYRTHVPSGGEAVAWMRNDPRVVEDVALGAEPPALWVMKGWAFVPLYTAPPSAPVGVEGFDAMRKALADLVRAGKRFRNTVVETRGVRGMDEHDLALSAAESALAQQPAHPPGTPTMPPGKFHNALWKSLPVGVQHYARMLTQSWATADSTELKNALEAAVLALAQQPAAVDARRPIAWIVQTKHHGECYQFSNEFLEHFPEAPVDMTPVDPAPPNAPAGMEADIKEFVGNLKRELSDSGANSTLRASTVLYYIRKLESALAQQPAPSPSNASLVQTALLRLPQYISKSSLTGPDKHSAMQCFEVLRDAIAKAKTTP